jgi:hypothetical protein
MTPVRLSDIRACLQGIIPSMIATSDGRGVPNVTYISQVYYVDERHVALSCQFFNKTRRNLDENPMASVEVADPLTLQPYRLRLKFLRSEKSGPLFDVMAMRIDAIASHTGMTGVFKLIAADVFEVMCVERVEGALAETDAFEQDDRASLEGFRTEVRGLQWVSERINRAADLEALFGAVLTSLEEYFGFTHTSVLLHDECTHRLTTIASRGYGESGAGAEVAIGEGIIGLVARDRRIMRVTALDSDLRYGRAIRRETSKVTGNEHNVEIPMPGIPDAQSVLAIPLLIGDRLVGVLSAEDRDPMRFGEWHEAYLEIIGNQIALGIDRMASRSDDAASVLVVAEQGPSTRMPQTPEANDRRMKKRLTYYKCDDAIFIDDEYLIRNVPARILWKVLHESQRTGRTEFSNRELRLDEGLGLPPVRDNLEARLILLRQRLKDKCPEVQLVPTARGRFALKTRAIIEMTER